MEELIFVSVSAEAKKDDCSIGRIARYPPSAARSFNNTKWNARISRTVRLAAQATRERFVADVTTVPDVRQS
jgi:hypothetical protein